MYDTGDESGRYYFNNSDETGILLKALNETRKFLYDMVNEITGQVGSTQVFLAEKSGEMVQHLGKAKDSAERLINLIQKFKL